MTTPEGKLLHTLDLKRLVDLEMLEPCRIKYFDPGKNDIIDRDATAFFQDITGYLKGDLVLAYKFGYAKNFSYSRLKNFLFYPTLLYATFPVPRLIYLKQIVYFLIILFGLLGTLTGMWILIDIPLNHLLGMD